MPPVPLTRPDPDHVVLVDALATRFGGAAQVLIATARLLAADQRVRQLTVLVTAGSVPDRHLRGVPGLKLVSVGATGRLGLARRAAWEAWRLPLLVRRERPTVLVTMSGMLPRHPDVPIVSILLNQVPLQGGGGPGARIRRWAIRRSARHAAVLHAPTAAQAHLLRAVTDRPVAVVPHGVDHELFRPAPEPGNEILYVADFYAHKRHDLVIEAWRGLPLQRPVLRLIGDPQPEPATFARVQRLVAGEDRVRISPRVPQEEVAAAYRSARMLLLPSENESFAMPIAEALATGVPVIARDAPVLRETGGPGAIYVAADDPHAWTEAMAKLAQDDDLHAALRAAGIGHAAGFRWERTVEEILAASALQAT